MASEKIKAYKTPKAEIYKPAQNPYLYSDVSVVYNDFCVSFTIRGVQNIQPDAETVLFRLPADAYPRARVYQDYITTNGNHFRMIITTDGIVSVYSYQSAITTDTQYVTTVAWAL